MKIGEIRASRGGGGVRGICGGVSIRSIIGKMTGGGGRAKYKAGIQGERNMLAFSVSRG